MKILITGGAGFIGSHISRILLDEGHTVLIYDNLFSGHIEDIDKRALFLEGDLKDQKKLKNSLDGVDWVIHMAGFIEVGRSVEDPVGFTDNNVIGSVHLLEAMREAGVKKIIFSSSACVYGVPEKLPIVEEERLKSDNPYGASKIAVEAFCETYHNLHGFDVVILRYFNPYGPGENHASETHAIPNFIKNALAKKPLPVFGKGELVRDFIYVEDLARAHIALLKLSGFQIFNVGTEKGSKVNDVINIISDLLGYDLEVEDLGNRPGDVPKNYASSKKLNKATGWKSKVSLKQGLEKTI